MVRIAKTNTSLKLPVNKLFIVDNRCHDTNQTDKAREKVKARNSRNWWSKEKIWMLTAWKVRRGGVFEHYSYSNNLLIRYNKTQ